MKAFPETEIPNAHQQTEPGSAPEAATPRREIPPPGHPMSFEEALSMTMNKYDNALRELAK